MGSSGSKSGSKSPFNVIGDTASSLGSKIIGGAKVLGEKIKDGASKVIDLIPNKTISDTFEKITDLTNPILSKIQPIAQFTEKVFKIRDKFMNEMPFVKDLLKGIENKIGNMIGNDRILHDIENTLKLISNGDFTNAQKYIIKNNLMPIIGDKLPSNIKRKLESSLSLEKV